MNHLISVIIPCYNQAIYLPEALQSILNQTYTNWECIIINDGSPDQTEHVAKEWVLKNSRFKYFFKTNGGLSSARNCGISKAKGKYILTLDADDKFENSFLEKAMNIMDNEFSIGLVTCWLYKFTGNTQGELTRTYGNSIEDFLFWNAANVGSIFFRKESWEQVGGYDENMKKGYEDWEFYIRVCQAGWKLKVIEEPLFWYRQHTNSMRRNALFKYDKEIKIYIYKKHEKLYKKHYSKMINYFLTELETAKKTNIKIQNKIDFQLGSILLFPIRKIKLFVKKVKD